jgi:hypothetical protein
MNDKPSPNKWQGSELDFKKARDMATEAVREYGFMLFRSQDNITRGDATREFFERLAEFWGFKIVWPESEDYNSKPGKD